VFDAEIVVSTQSRQSGLLKSSHPPPPTQESAVTEDLATVHELTPLEDLLDVLESLARNHALAFRLEVGRVLLDAFFGGDGGAYQSHDSTKDARFALFFAHCRNDLDKLGIGESTARNCIKARLVYDLLPAPLQAALFFSQVVELTRVPDPTARTRLAVAAVQGDWTVRQLRDAVGHVLAGGEIDGDPSAPGIQPPAEDPADDGPQPQAPVTSCDDSNSCTADACASASGCLHTAVQMPCTDGNACTVGDTCSNGSCSGGAPLDCDDGNPCKADSCDPGVGCSHVLAFGPCDDGNPCTNGETCIGGTCTGGKPISCDDANPCTNDSCNLSLGCVHVPAAGACNDGKYCTVDDKCDANGSCLGGGLRQCGSYASCSEGEECHCGKGMVAIDVDGISLCIPDFPIWGVRPLSPPSAWFVDNGDGTVTDTDTTLGHRTCKSPMPRKPSVARRLTDAKSAHPERQA
jgi:hypothetical protein